MRNQTISIQSLGAEHNFAQAIEGFHDLTQTTLCAGPVEQVVRANRSMTELRFPGSSTVTIHRVEDVFGERQDAFVSWSSSSSAGSDPVLTARLLAFAAGVVALLNEWAESGQLPRLAPTSGITAADAAAMNDSDPNRGIDCTTIREGAEVDVEIRAPGGPVGRVLGSIRGFVLNAGGEYDVAIDWEQEDLEDVEHLLGRCDVTLADLYDAHGGRHILRNCQRGELTRVTR